MSRLTMRMKALLALVLLTSGAATGARRRATVTVTVTTVNAGTSIARDQCLIIAAGDFAAYECGDLRIIHALPSTRTMNRDRTPTLVYNDAHAHGRAIVAADVSLPGGTNATSLDVGVTVAGHTISRTFTWNSAWSGGAPRRIVVPVDGASLSIPTGAYSYSLTVSAKNGGTELDSGSGSGTLVIVNRSASPFGAGWWLEGLEQLVTVSSTQKLWVGGDGSTRVYTQQGTSTTWIVSPTVDRPDTLVDSSSTFLRYLPGGGRVRFNTSGQHVATVNRLRQTTSFAYSGSQLTSITLPVKSGSAPSYSFDYGVNGALLRVVAPGTRIDSVFYSTGTAVSKIKGPDSTWVGFAYSGSSVVTRRNRRNDSTFFAFDEAGLLKQVTIDMRNTGLSDVVSTFCPAESRSVTTCSSGPQLLASVRTKFDGPRADAADTTLFYVNRFSAPDSIIDALGGRTLVARDNSSFPLLVTSLKLPNGFEKKAAYNSSALADSAWEVAPYGGSNAVTRYAWSTACRAATKIRNPAGDSITFSYDGVCSRSTERPGGNASREVSYAYTSTLLSSMTEPTSRTTSLRYDNWGNLDTVITPLGFRTEFLKDAAGHDSVVKSAISDDASSGARRLDVYTRDKLDRITQVQSIGPAVSYTLPNSLISGTIAAETLIVINTLDQEGNVTRVQRRSAPDPNALNTTSTSFSYDRLHRKTGETDTRNRAQSWTYDAAGNVASWTTRRSDTLSYTYDGLNRLTQRITPSVQYSQELCGFCTLTAIDDQVGDNTGTKRFPYYSTLLDDGSLSTSVIVKADTATFSYDANGNLLTAYNHDARVKRSYYANGAVQTDTLRVTTYDRHGYGGDPFAVHVYGLGFSYDLNGRRTSRTGVACSSQTYHYHTQINALDTTTFCSRTFAFVYDDAGRLTERHWPSASLTESRTYDSDDNVSERVFSNSAYDDLLSWDARGKVTGASITATGNGLTETATLFYSGLGSLAESERYRNGAAVDQYVLDALGNMRSHVTDAGLTSTSKGTLQSYNGSDQISWSGESAFPTGIATENDPPVQRVDTSLYSFDNSGNEKARDNHTWLWQGRSTRWPDDTLGIWHATGEGNFWSRSYYGADEKLRVYQRTGWETPPGGSTAQLRVTFSEYFYDALGRRVMVRTRRDSSCTSGTDPYCVQPLERTIWDGDEIVAERRADGGFSQSATALETESSFGNFLGVVEYAFGPGVSSVDQPLAFWKDGTGIIPHLSWRGHYETGTYLTGGTANSLTWPNRYRDYQLVNDARESPPSPSMWMGSLVEGKVDHSGLVYQRNRYYDPRSGRFTQEDPIGVAGGVNLYGFASGDPINYSDPFGLCPPEKPLCQWIEAISMAAGTDLGAMLGGGTGLFAGPGALVASPAAAMAGAAAGAGAGLAFGKALTNVLFSDAESVKSGKSASEYDKHIEGKSRAEEELGRLREKLEATKGPKAQRPILDQIRKLEQDIKGHEKEIRQKWPDGRPD